MKNLTVTGLIALLVSLASAQDGSGPNLIERYDTEDLDITDVIVVKSGAAAIPIGGEVVDPRGSEGELRADSIRGGELILLVPATCSMCRQTWRISGLSTRTSQSATSF
jgi:hypothetical protein